jgi:hypothetical protein
LHPCSLHSPPPRSEINQISQPPAATGINMVLEARGGAGLAGEVRNYSFSCINIYFISMRLDSSSTPLSLNHPNKSRHVLKKIGLETAKGGQFLLGPFYLFTTRCLNLRRPPLPQAVSVSFTSTAPIHIAPPPCHQPCSRRLNSNTGNEWWRCLCRAGEF